MQSIFRPYFLLTLLLLSPLAAISQRVKTPIARQTPAPTLSREIPGPDEQFGKLFADVELKRVFPDSKTFADCTPKLPVETILADYEKNRTTPGFDLKAFVLANFTLPAKPASGYTSQPDQSAQQHILDLWPVLTRPADMAPGKKSVATIGTLIPLPKPYVVPGGRFGEVYYWDSYFTMLGLQASAQPMRVRHMIDNFAHLIRTFGFIPNGNRTYYLGRSQPPFFSFMVNLLSEMQGRRVLATYLPQLQQEYNFWMDGKSQLTAQNPAYRRVVQLADGVYLNRYFDDKDTPRPESYREDVLLAAQRGPSPPKVIRTLYRNIRAGAESGWDFSSRWFGDSRTLATIHTTDFIPVDLNCLLLNLERTLAEGYRLKGDTKQAVLYQQLARQRQAALLTYCWDGQRQFFFDYDFMAKKTSSVYSLAAVYPLFVKIATPAQAQAVARVLQRDFLKSGGLITTTTRTGEQWDAPNGWAPLQWLSIRGLRNYNLTALATQVKIRWVAENLRVYKASGKMVEKYDVVSTAGAKGGEYPNQDGFGWTNGVLLRLLTEK